MSGGESNAKGQEHETPKGSEELSGKDWAALRRRGSSPKAELNRKCRVLELIIFNHIKNVTHLLYLYNIHVIDCDSHSIGRVRESLAKTTKLAVTSGAAEVHNIQD